MNLALRLLREQLAYRRLSIAVVWTALAVFLIVVRAFGDADSEDLLELSGFACFFTACGLGFHGWLLDTKERRLRLDCVLPVSRRSIVAARLLEPVAVQVGIVIPAFAIVGLGGGEVLPVSYRLTAILAAALWGLTVVLCGYFVEELNIAVSRWPPLVWICNLSPIPLALWFATWSVRTEREFFEMPWAMVFAALAGLALAGGTAVLFTHRRTFELGVSPVHGFPVRWSED